MLTGREGEGGGRRDRSKRGRLKMNSDAKRGHSCSCFTVKDLGYKAHENRQMEVWGSMSQEGKRGINRWKCGAPFLKKGRGDWGLVLSSHGMPVRSSTDKNPRAYFFYSSFNTFFLGKKNISF